MIPRSRYQLFPTQPADRREALVESIRQRGIETPTVWDEQGNLLDGWERESVCQELRITCPREVRHFGREAAKYQFVLAVNAHRRTSLSQKQKREVIAGYLRGDPAIADNALGQTLGVSKNTVADVRRHLETTCQIDKLNETRGRDGKLRPVKYKKIITSTPREFQRALEIMQNLPDHCAGKTLDMVTATRRARRAKRREETAILEREAAKPQLGDTIRMYHSADQAEARR